MESMMTPEELVALKDEILQAVEVTLGEGMETTRPEAIDLVVAAIEALKGEPEMGGMGDEDEMELPEEETEE